jgi:hypothetical protein
VWSSVKTIKWFCFFNFWDFSVLAFLFLFLCGDFLCSRSPGVCPL